MKLRGIALIVAGLGIVIAAWAAITPASAAVCLLIPQCQRNADCAAYCGSAGGRCVHNNCPARICKCN